MTRTTGEAGIRLVKDSEDTRLFAYPDPASPLAKATRSERWGFEDATHILSSLAAEVCELSGSPWTIGVGHTAGVQPSHQITEHQADVMLHVDLADAERCVNLRAPALNQNQFDACVSFVFNMGCRKFDTSTLLRLIRGRDYKAAADQFLRWDHAGAETLPGLTKRRKAERALFLTQAPPDFSNVTSGAESTAPKA